jgi:putative cardiolipin synthase
MLIALRIAALVLLAALCFIVAMRLVFPLPPLQGRVATSAIPATGDVRLARNIAPLAAAHPGQSGVVPLFEGTDAFSTRMLLARAAEQSIDAQYYIWQNDLTGIPLLAELRAAAERGVRVRLLVDDNGTPDLDRELATLNALPNAEVRIFNPFNLRTPRLLSYTFDFFRLNRRMHNKSFTVDGTATIIGGRNVGDIYFARDAETQYSDLDLLAVGQVVTDVSREFDRYWNSLSAYPHELLVAPPADGPASFDARLSGVLADAGTAEYADALGRSVMVRDLAAGTLRLLWADTQLVSDDPAKGLGLIPSDRLMITRLASIAGAADKSIDLISAYFVPGNRGVEMLAGAVASGVRVRTLTNSLDATDVLPVHASYTKYRKRLLDAGVEVYELKADRAGDTPDIGIEVLGRSASSLHAKTLILDADRVFIGSFNFDPRSVFLNCEMGFLVRSPELARAVTRSFDDMFGERAWRVTYGQGRGLVWQDGAGEAATTEPGASAMNSIALTVIGWLPIEWLM